MYCVQLGKHFNLSANELTYFTRETFIFNSFNSFFLSYVNTSFLYFVHYMIYGLYSKNESKGNRLKHVQSSHPPNDKHYTR